MNKEFELNIKAELPKVEMSVDGGKTYFKVNPIIAEGTIDFSLVDISEESVKRISEVKTKLRN